MDTLRDDARRFRALHDQLQRRVRALAGRYRPFVDDDMLTDACHDVIVATVVQYQGNFEAPADDPAAFDDALLGYLFNAARNRLMSALRRDARAREMFLDGGDDEDGAPDETLAQVSPWAPDEPATPETEARAHQRRLLLRDCLAGLTELARRTFLMALEGFNDQEIQRELNVAAASTVRRRVHDTKAKVMECVQTKLAAGACA